MTSAYIIHAVCTPIAEGSGRDGRQVMCEAGGLANATIIERI
ncbi:hypothetical protein [Micromonospora craterilacus]|nr:hypothetical protein [Micromonospora craterilacus]